MNKFCTKCGQHTASSESVKELLEYSAKLTEKNKALRESRDELLEAAKAMWINLKCVPTPGWFEAIDKAEAQKDKEK